MIFRDCVTLKTGIYQNNGQWHFSLLWFKRSSDHIVKRVDHYGLKTHENSNITHYFCRLTVMQKHGPSLPRMSVVLFAKSTIKILELAQVEYYTHVTAKNPFCINLN